jgi:hypothetical protein
MTGLAFFDISVPGSPKQLWSKELDVVETRIEMESVTEFHQNNVLVVIENFIITEATAKKTSAPWSLKLIGNAEWFCWKYGARLVVQQPVDIGEVTSEDLRKANFWHVSTIQAEHGRDACKHALVYLKNTDRRWARLFL